MQTDDENTGNAGSDPTSQNSGTDGANAGSGSGASSSDQSGAAGAPAPSGDKPSDPNDRTDTGTAKVPHGAPSPSAPAAQPNSSR